MTTYINRDEDTLDITMEVKVRNFIVPDCVDIEGPTSIKGGGFVEFLRWKLSDVDERTLSKLCDQFREDVFKKAGKIDSRAGY